MDHKHCALISGDKSVTAVREGLCKIAIETAEPLSDEQMADLHIIALFMHKTGGGLRDVFLNPKGVIDGADV